MCDIGMIKGGACLEAPLKRRRVVVDVVDHRDISSGLGVYQREEGEETVNIKQHSSTKHNMAIRCAGCDLTYGYTIKVKGENNRECFPYSGPVSD